MSFSYKIKEKLGKIMPDCPFCRSAELFGLLRFAGQRRRDGFYFASEHEATIDVFCSAISEEFGFSAEPCGKSKNGIFLYRITDPNALDQLKERFMLREDGRMENPEEIMPFSCCRESYLRGAFLGGGSISDPQKSYHMEFDANEEPVAEELLEVLEELEVHAKTTVRKGHVVVYIKGYEEIAAVLGAVGAGSAAMEIFNISIEKEIRNGINRQLNCENANMDKIVKAYGKHFMAIEKIKSSTGLEVLPEKLREAAELRMEYPDESLKELGERLGIGKSGVNHRLNRLIEISESI